MSTPTSPIYRESTAKGGLFITQTKPASRIEHAKKSIQNLAAIISSKCSEAFNSIKEFFKSTKNSIEKSANKFTQLAIKQTIKLKKFIFSSFFHPSYF